MPEDAVGSRASDPGPEVSTANATVIDQRFPSDFRWVRRGLQQTMHSLESQGLSLEELGSLEIVLAEALNNIVEHAYTEDPPGEIRLVIRRRPGGLLVEIRDRGRPMPKGRAPIGNHPMSEFHHDDAMPEGGYGWFLIRELVRDLVYDRRDGENFLVFRMALVR